MTRHRAILLLFALALLGGGVRVSAVWPARDHALLWDHLDFMNWADWSFERGPLAVYDLPAGRLLNTRIPFPWAGRPLTEPIPAPSACNYPPLSVYICWLQGGLWHTLDSEIVCLPPPDGAAVGPAPAVCTRVANTAVARLAGSLLPIVGDVLLAAGVLALVRIRRQAAPYGRSEAAALILVALGPPFFLLSGFWGQYDSLLMAPSVWCLVAWLRQRSLLSGLCCGAALLIKPQALLLLPVLAFAFLAHCRLRGVKSALRNALIALWGTAATVAILAGPFSYASAGSAEHGWARWVYRGYVTPVTEQFPYTTLRAFNLWWIDYAASSQHALAVDRVAVLGLTKAQAGYLLAVALLVAASVVCVRRWGWGPTSVAALGFLWWLIAFTCLPKMHDRYLYYCLPFLVAVAVSYRPWWPALAALFLVATCELTWPTWLVPGYEPVEAAPTQWGFSVCLAFLVVGSLFYALLVPAVAAGKPVAGAGPDPG